MDNHFPHFVDSIYPFIAWARIDEFSLSINDIVCDTFPLLSVSFRSSIIEPPINESVDDSFVDLSVYGVIAQIVRNKGTNHPLQKSGLKTNPLSLNG